MRLSAEFMPGPCHASCRHPETLLLPADSRHAGCGALTRHDARGGARSASGVGIVFPQGADIGSRNAQSRSQASGPSSPNGLTPESNESLSLESGAVVGLHYAAEILARRSVPHGLQMAQAGFSEALGVVRPC